MGSDVDVLKAPPLDAQRDAIHVAVVPLVAGEFLYKGCGFKLAYGTTDVALHAEGEYGEEVLGVINPFMHTYGVNKGERCWGFLFPGSVTGMRHHWKHPKFDHAPVPGSAHEQWLRQFCDKYNFDWRRLIEAGTTPGKAFDWDGDNGFRECAVARGIDLHSADDLDAGEEALFWYHLEQYTGEQFNQEHRDGMGWSCSC